VQPSVFSILFQKTLNNMLTVQVNKETNNLTLCHYVDCEALTGEDGSGSTFVQCLQAYANLNLGLQVSLRFRFMCLATTPISNVVQRG